MRKLVFYSTVFSSTSRKSRHESKIDFKLKCKSFDIQICHSILNFFDSHAHKFHGFTFENECVNVAESFKLLNGKKYFSRAAFKTCNFNIKSLSIFLIFLNIRNYVQSCKIIRCLNVHVSKQRLVNDMVRFLKGVAEMRFCLDEKSA